MTTPQYMVTKSPGFILDGPFGKLWKLSDNKWARDKNLIYYDQIAEGKLEDLAKLAQEMNSAGEMEAAVAEMKEEPRIEYETVSVKSELIDGIPTVPRWIVENIKRDVELADAGKINLVEFIGRVRQMVEAAE